MKVCTDWKLIANKEARLHLPFKCVSGQLPDTGLQLMSKSVNAAIESYQKGNKVVKLEQI